MDIRRLYPLVLLLAVSNPHGGCDRGDGQDGSKDATQDGPDRNGGCGGGCGNGCSSSTDDSVIDDTGTGDSVDTAPPADADGDGYTTDDDCDDTNDSVNPGAVDLCDAIDNNCDGNTDEGVTACFYGTDGNTTSLEGDFTAGVEAAPADVILDTPGRLVLGSGKWFVSLRISAEVTIEGAGADLTVLSGASLVSIVVTDNPSTPYTVNLSGLSMIDGFGSELHLDDSRYPAGGAVFCRSAAASSTKIVMDDIIVSATVAERGGVVYSSGCDLEISNSAFSGALDAPPSSTGGAMYLIAANVSLTNTTVAGFSVTRQGGAVFLDETSSLRLVDSVLSDNSAETGGSISARGAVFCEGTTAAAGVWRGVATESGGGVFLDINHSPTLTSTGCDWGSGDDDNSPDDVGSSESFSVTTLTTESFTCDVNGCTLTE